MSSGRFGIASARPAVIAAGLLVGQQIAGKAARDALFLSHFEVSSLPAMTAAAAALSLVSVLLFARGMAVFSPTRLVPAAITSGALLFGVEAGLVAAWPRAAAVLLYLHQAVLGAALVSGFWSLVNESFDPYTAKRAMGAIGVGASLGGVLGGVLAWRVAGSFGVETLLLALAAASLLALASVRSLRPGRASPPPEPETVGATSSRPSALRLVRSNLYLRELALLVLACAFLEAILDYLLNAGAAARFAKGAPLVEFFGLFHAGTGLLTLLLQASLVPALLARLGLAGTLAVQPAFAAVGAAAAFSFPGLAAIVTLRLGQAALRNSTFRSSYELLYTPLPTEQKRSTKVIIDVGCDRIGTMLGSAAAMLTLAVASTTSTRALLLLAAVAAAISMALAARFHAGYVRALVTSLRSGAVNLEDLAALDATTRLTLASVQPGLPPAVVAQGAPRDSLLRAIADLRSGDAERVRRALQGDTLDRLLVPHVIPLLAQDALFELASRRLRHAAPRCTGQLIDALLDPELDPVVRRRIPRVLKAVTTQRVADGLLLGLADARFDLRYRCAQALERLRGRDGGIELPRERILSLVQAEANHISKSAQHLDCVFILLELVLPQEPLEIALRALRAGDDRLRGTALEYLENVVPTPVREKLWPHVAGEERPRRSGRTPDEVRDELLRSTSALDPPQTDPEE